MKKRLIFVFILFLASALIFNSKVFSATTTAAEQSENWVCLSSERCGNCEDTDGDGEADADSCYFYSEGICTENNDDPLSYEHRARIKQMEGKSVYIEGVSTDNLPAVYIAVCLDTEDDTNCTTGSSETDEIVYKQDNYSFLNSKYEYVFEGLYDVDGTKRDLNYIPAGEEFTEYEWQDYTPQSFDRRYYALTYFDAETGAGGADDEASTVQLGTIPFSFSDLNSEDCISVHWDPYGRIFDSQTLEPIKGAKVTLLMKRQNGIFSIVTKKDVVGGAIINPYTTKEDGAFNFVVPKGDYKITVEHPDYNFPNSASILNQNYKNIYWQIYPNQTGDLIQERPPKLEYRDIPLDPKKLPANNNIKIMSYSYVKNKLNGTSTVSGRLSVPFGIVHAYSLKNNLKYRLITSVQADKYGRFDITIDETKFERLEVFGQLEYDKIKLTGSLNPEKATLLNSTVILKLNPIVNYVEGYAYDLTGKIIPNAIVEVYLKFSQRPYYSTKADNTGYYKIDSANLPSLAYSIKYKSSAGVITAISTADFVAQNKQIIEKNKINLNTYRYTEKEKVAIQKVAEAKAITESLNKEKSNSNIKTIVILITLIVLTLGLAAAVGFYFYKKNSPLDKPY